MSQQFDPKKQEETIGSFYMGRMRPPPPPPKRVVPKGMLTAVAILAFIAIVWYAYPQGQEKYDGADVPLIKADPSTYKFKPEDPGGMEVRHQDSTVFDPLEKKGGAEVEKLMPTTEEPMNKDTVLQEKPAIDSNTPQLNLDSQMQKVGDGMEKVVFPAPAEEKPAPVEKTEKTDKKPAVTSKPSPKPSSKTEAAPVKPAERKPAETKAAEVKPKAEEKKVPAPSAISGSTYVRLGSYRNRAGAEQDWAAMKKKYPQYLGGLNMRVMPVDLGAKGTYNRLEAGGVTDTRAREICNALAKSSGGCIVVK